MKDLVIQRWFDWDLSQPAAPGAMTAAGAAGSTGAATITGSGALVAAGVAPSVGPANVQPSIQAPGVSASAGQAAAIGISAITAAGLSASSGSSSLTGSGALSAGGAAASKGVSSLAGSGALSGAGVSASTGDASLQPALQGSGASASTGLANVSAGIKSVGVSAATGAANLTGAGALTASGAGASMGEASLTGAGALAGAGGASSKGTASLAGNGALVASGASAATGAGNLQVPGSGSLSVQGVSSSVGTALASGLGALVGVGTASSVGRAQLGGAASLTASASSASTSNFNLQPRNLIGWGGSASIGSANLAVLPPPGVVSGKGLALSAGQVLLSAVINTVPVPNGVSPELNLIYQTLRQFIQTVIGGTPQVEVILGLDNRVSMPSSPFIVMTAIGQYRLETNVDTDVDGYFQLPRLAGTTQSKVSMRLEIKLDFYGPDSADWAVIVGTLFRDEYATNFLSPLMQPLYADDPRMVPLITGEDQYLEHWILLASVQYDPVTVTGQTFATTLHIVPINVDEAFKP